ncbi:hypothetical protein V1281_002578 [Nitrobacteraceae bacterium AZCC 2161]
MKTATGFEMQGRFRMPNDEPPGLEGGQVVRLFFGGATEPVACTVTKVFVYGDERVVSFVTPLVTRIEA